MPTQLQLRRGTTVQHSSFTGAVGEVTINTTKKTAVVHDGSTAGGLELLRADMSNIFSSATPTITSLNTTGNVDVGGNLTVTGTSTFNGGTINLGDAAGDNVVFGADINSNIIPNTDNTYNLGSAGQKWANLNVVNITQTGNTTTSGTLGVTGNFAVNTNKFTVDAATGNTVIAGNLTVDGTTTTINSTTISVDDKNIELASTASPSDATADGAGITIKGTTDKTFNWVDATDAFTSSEHIETAAGKTLALSGSSSGKTTINVAATASGTLTLPSATDTLVGRATTDTLTNKTLTTPSITSIVNAGIPATYTAGVDYTTINLNNFTGNIVISTNPAFNPWSNQAGLTNLTTVPAGTVLTFVVDGQTYTGTTATTWNYQSMAGYDVTLNPSTYPINPTVMSKEITSISFTPATTTITLPNSTATLVGRDTTDTLTNKTINLSSNTFTATSAQLATAITDETGSGSLVFATSPILSAPEMATIVHSSTAAILTLPNTADTLVGRETTDTLTNKTLTSPKIGTSILDTNGNELFLLTATGSAVNELTLANSATGNNPILSATGDDTNIGIEITPKGTGTIILGNTQIAPGNTIAIRGASTGETKLTVDGNTTGTLTLPSATDTLVGKATTDTLTNKSISLATNTISGTLAEFNTALSDDNFVSLTGTETLTNKTLTAAKIVNGGFIADANGNEQLIFNTTASAVNELTLTNAATGNRPIISATGNDTNIGISIAPKGTGTILVGNSIIPSSDSTMDLGATGARFRDLYLSGASIIMGTTKIMMHADGYLQFNTNSAGGYPAGSNVSVATAANGVAATNSNALAYSIALGGA